MEAAGHVQMTAMQQRVSLITLGVADVPTSLAFYRALGWVEHPRASDPGEIAFFQAGGLVVALWDRTKLAADSRRVGRQRVGRSHLRLQRRHPGGGRRAARARARRPEPASGALPAETEWGGYSGVFVDPDGHPGEVAHNPYWSLDADGAVNLGD